MSRNPFCKRVALAALAVIALTPALSLAQTNGGPAATKPPIDTGTTAWILTSTTLALPMVPGLAMFYSGLVRTKNVIGTMHTDTHRRRRTRRHWVTIPLRLPHYFIHIRN